MTSVATRAVSVVLTVGPDSSVLLAPTNDNRNRVTIHNEGGVLYVGLGPTVSSSTYAYRLSGNSTLEIDGYVGRLSGIKASGSTSVFITEII